MRFDPGAATVSGNIIWSNADDDVITCAAGASLDFKCNDVSGGLVGDWTGCASEPLDVTANFSADPLFCDAEGGDFSLSSQSPCLPGNHPDGADCGLIGAFGQGCGPVSVEQETWAGIKKRYRR